MEKEAEQAQQPTQGQAQPLIRNFNTESLKSAFTPKVIALLLAVVVVGVLSGYLISARNTISISGIKPGVSY